MASFTIFDAIARATDDPQARPAARAFISGSGIYSESQCAFQQSCARFAPRTAASVICCNNAGDVAARKTSLHASSFQDFVSANSYGLRPGQNMRVRARCAC